MPLALSWKERKTLEITLQIWPDIACPKYVHLLLSWQCPIYGSLPAVPSWRFNGNETFTNPPLMWLRNIPIFNPSYYMPLNTSMFLVDIPADDDTFQCVLEFTQSILISGQKPSVNIFSQRKETSHTIRSLVCWQSKIVIQLDLPKIGI